MPVHLVKQGFWTCEEHAPLNFLVLHFRFTNYFLHDNLQLQNMWQFNRHFSGYSLASGSLLVLDKLTYSDIFNIQSRYFMKDCEALYTVERGYIRDAELIRNFLIEYIQSGTWTCYVCAYNPPTGLMKVIKKVVTACVKDTSGDLYTIAKFNFTTLQDSLVHVFDVFNEVLFLAGGPQAYGHDYRHHFHDVPPVTRTFAPPPTSRL